MAKGVVGRRHHVDRGPHHRCLDDGPVLERPGQLRPSEVLEPAPRADVAAGAYCVCRPPTASSASVSGRPDFEELPGKERAVQAALGQDGVGHRPQRSRAARRRQAARHAQSPQRATGIGASRYFPVAIRIDVPAAHQDHHRAFDPGQSCLRGTERRRRHGQRPGRLDDEPGSFGQQPHGRRDLVLVDGDDVVDQPPDVGERARRKVRAGSSAIVRRLFSRGHATSSPPRNDSWASAASSGSTPMIRTPGWSARTAVAIPLMSPPPGTSSAPRSSAAGDLEAGRALPGDHVVVVVRVDERDAVRFPYARAASWLVTGPSGSTVITSAPSARTSSFTAVASAGMNTVAGTPSRRAARATPWPWLPLDDATTHDLAPSDPAARSRCRRPGS